MRFAGRVLIRRLCSGADQQLRFIYDAETEAPLFFANKIGRQWYEQDYRAAFLEACCGVSEDAAGSIESAVLDSELCMAATRAVGRTAASREIGICTIPRIFHDRRCYAIRKWRGKDFWYHSVQLKPLQMEKLLIREEIAKRGLVRRTRYLKLKASLDAAVVKHAVEVHVSKQAGCNFVIFLSKQEMGKRSAISRELAKAGVSVDDLKLDMWKPEDDSFYAETLRNKRSLTRQRENTINHMKERLLITHCRTSPRSEARQKPVEWYEDFGSQPLYRQHYYFDTDKLELELDTESWGIKKEAIPWEERMTAKPGGKIKEVLQIVEINGTPAELMIPKRRMRGWSVPRIQTRVRRSKSGGENVRFSKTFVER